MELKKEMKGIKVGIGFATGRKSFKKVLRSYIHNWKESGLVDDISISLNVFVAYDLNYNKTVKKDYTNIHPELLDAIDAVTFMGVEDIDQEIKYLSENRVISNTEAKKIFGKGYSAQRNAVVYNAIKNGMDYLIFLDDDEYPVAVTRTRKNAVWGGQHVISTHIKYIEQADLTHGYHCGYISPIPFIKYNDKMSEKDFRSFIEAISNDILSWDNVNRVMNNGGVTYADTEILIKEEVKEVQEIDHAKFISGANLGINLKNPEKVFPFYNPPGARGEDTFLSTCLTDRTVLKVPCYTFHDGFSTYHHLLEGVLPIQLQFIKADNKKNVDRFYKACMGWIRYKPLLLYITHPDTYESKIEETRSRLMEALPKVSMYFDEPEFMNLLHEFEKYNRNVHKHNKEFVDMKNTWAKLMTHMCERGE